MYSLTGKVKQIMVNVLLTGLSRAQHRLKRAARFIIGYKANIPCAIYHNHFTFCAALQIYYLMGGPQNDYWL